MDVCEEWDFQGLALGASLQSATPTDSLELFSSPVQFLAGCKKKSSYKG